MPVVTGWKRLPARGQVVESLSRSYNDFQSWLCFDRRLPKQERHTSNAEDQLGARKLPARAAHKIGAPGESLLNQQLLMANTNVQSAYSGICGPKSLFWGLCGTGSGGLWYGGPRFSGSAGSDIQWVQGSSWS